VREQLRGRLFNGNLFVDENLAPCDHLEPSLSQQNCACVIKIDFTALPVKRLYCSR